MMEGAVVFACIILSAMSGGMFVMMVVGMTHLGRIADALERIVEEEQ
jgi:hypothetical protein